mgnify:CR=1 FL=1
MPLVLHTLQHNRTAHGTGGVAANRLLREEMTAAAADSRIEQTAIAQAFYNKQEGVKRITTETGAGQWGSSIALACQLFGLECTVYMVKVSFTQKPYRKSMMQLWGAEVLASPSNQTNAGRMIFARVENDQ